MKSRNSAKLNRLDHFTVESLIRDGDSLDRHGARRGKPGFTLDGGGLYLKTTRGAVTDNQGKVIAPGTGSWAFRYEKDGTPRYPGLGVCSSVTLKEARDRAHEMRKLLDSGIDPLDHREAVKQKAEIDKAKAVTFGFCAELWLQRKRDARRDKEYVDNLKANLRKYAGDLWDLPIRSIDTTIVLTILEPIWTRIPPTADGVVRFALEQIFDLAKARGYRDRDSENPARWKGNLQHVLLVRASELHTVQHRRMLPYAELPKLITVLRNWDKQPGLKRDGTFARAQHFMILTTTRPKETSGARFDEIDFKNRIWHIPAARMKKRRAHDIPLPEQAMEIVQEQYERAITGARHFTSLGRRIRAAIEAHPDFGCDRIARIVGCTPKHVQNIQRDQQSPPRPLREYIFEPRLKSKQPYHGRPEYMHMALSRMGYDHVDSHGFRASFSTWCFEERNLEYPKDLRELQLAHKVDNAVAEAYQRGTGLALRRRMLQDYADYCDGILTPKVVPLRRGDSA